MIRAAQLEISVVIPTFNGARFLGSLLPQVTAANDKYEVIVVDDGSTDETPAVIEDFRARVTYLRRSNQGPAAARNHGLRHARAGIVAFLDVDDEWVAPHPGSTLAIMSEQNREVVIGKTQCLTRTTEAETFVEYSEPFHTFNLGSALIRRDLFERVGGFDESLAFGEDVDWFLRAREAGARMALLDETTLHYRLHERNLIKQTGAAPGGLLNALHLSIDRRRRGASALADLPRIKR
jgi:glycosyltransferase involved in cell wall biosynthesis